MNIVTRIGGLIEAFRPADGPPPQNLAAFFRWCLSGSWSMLWIAGALSAVAGAMEVISALFLGCGCAGSLHRLYSGHGLLD